MAARGRWRALMGHIGAGVVAGVLGLIVLVGAFLVASGLLWLAGGSVVLALGLGGPLVLLFLGAWGYRRGLWRGDR